MFITIGMIFLGFVLSKVLGIHKEALKEFRDKALNLQDRLRNAQLLGDVQLMGQIQQETMQFTRQVMIKNFIPMCLRCLIFIGIWVVLGVIYSAYDSGLLPFPLLIFGSGWVAIYFIFYICFSLILFGIKKLYKKITGKETKTQRNLRDIMGIISPTQQGSGSPFQLSGTIPSDAQYQFTIQRKSTFEAEEDQSTEKAESWKERIEK